MLHDQQEKSTHTASALNRMSKDAQTNPTAAFAELRGELNLDREHVAFHDRRFGLPVPLGALVWISEVDEAIVVGGTDEIAIVVDAKGRQHAERWGVVTVQASGPAWLHDPAKARSIPAEADPAGRFFELARKLAALEDELDQATLGANLPVAIRDLAEEANEALAPTLRAAFDRLVKLAGDALASGENNTRGKAVAS